MNEKLRQINSFVRRRMNGPPGLDKCDINKKWNYETIKDIA